jgi:predicted esterase
MTTATWRTRQFCIAAALALVAGSCADSVPKAGEALPPSSNDMLLSELPKGTFGQLDLTRLYATGISSGGYMTSRVGIAYPGSFRALAIESGSYASCLGPLCSIPDQLPKDHPPTLMLHGGADAIVDISTARDYEAKLMSNGIEVKFVEDPAAGHQWLSSAPEEVTEWFSSH